MASYTARMMDAVTGGEGRYDFEGPDELLARTPVRVVRAFMEHVDRDLFPRVHIDYELNAAYNDRTRRVVTAMGTLIHDDDPPTPFLVMIGPKEPPNGG
ncbi:MAG: hypothetical protein NXI21_16350 [Alphaproteobacteria bacterium]|nr:hypothetical protein [Alphaproteobacteria bacterium]